MWVLIKISEEVYKHLIEEGEMDCLGIITAIENGLPVKEIQDGKIENELKDLSKRVENIEKQIKEDNEEQLRKLKAELDYAKFRCSLPTIQHMMRSEESE